MNRSLASLSDADKGQVFDVHHRGGAKWCHVRYRCRAVFAPHLRRGWEFDNLDTENWRLKNITLGPESTSYLVQRGEG